MTLADLRRPFTVDAVLFKVQTAKKDNTAALASWYIDARLVAERLTAVTGAEAWHDEYRPLFEANAQAHMGFHFPVECKLTVNGVTRVDVGIYQKAEADSLSVKSAYSDAFKRAAVKFGVGAYLYSLPNIWAQTYVNARGKVGGFTDEGIKQLRAGYVKWLQSGQPFGEPFDHGFAAAEPATEDEDSTDSPVASGPSGNPPTAQAHAPATGETPTIRSALDALIAAVGEANAKVAYDLALHNAGVQPGASATPSQTRQIIEALAAATGVVA